MKKGIQVLFLGLFTFLFFMAADPLRLPLPVDLFLRLDPLIAVICTLASRGLHTALLLSLLVPVTALFFGRFFCGYVCPLGTLIDFTENICGRRRGAVKAAETNSFALRSLKYYILLGLLLCAGLGVNLVHFFDPLSFLTRVYTFLVYPLSMFGVNAGLDVLRPAARQLHWTSLYYTSYAQPVYYMGLVTLAMLCGLVLLNRIDPRFWCRNLCPLGGLVSLFSRWGIFKRRVSSSCNRCMKCREDCPMGAIPAEPEQTQVRECIQCLRCKRICPQEAISFPANRGPSEAAVQTGPGLSKRGFLLSLGAGTVAALNLKASPFVRVADGRLIRPPGARPEDEFLDKCIRCGECMKVCPTNTLQPCLWQKGLDGLWSPRLYPRLAGCDQTCRLCGQVCPTGAIRALPLEEKKHAKLGTAFIVRDRCLVWEQDKACLICDEQCPYNAIVFKWQDGLRRPFVVEHKCNGCGFCEEKCPIGGESAIIVTPHDEIRLAEGSYIEAAKQFELEFGEDPGNDRFLYGNEETGEWRDKP